MAALPILIIVPLLLFAFIAALLGIWRQKLAYYTAVLGVLFSLSAAARGLLNVLTNGEQRYFFGGWPPPFGIEYVLDPLSAFMCVVVLGVGFLIVIYAPGAGFYQVPRKGIPVYPLLLLLLSGLTGVILTGDLFNLFVFLEIYSLASYTLITVSGKRALVAGFRYLILGTIAGGFYLLGVGFIYFATGSLNMADVARILPEICTSPAIMVAAALIIIGLGIKMALFPLHVWLPDAHSYAPPSVAAILASVQIEVAAYVLVRMMLEVFRPSYLCSTLSINAVIAWCGVAGILFGSILAIPQRDFKRMLAYSTVGQVGYIGLGIGLASPLGLIGALLHILNHAFMKSCLFLVAGGIRYQTGLREIPWFAGLGRRMPLTMAAFTVAAFSMIGIPPTAGFFSKWYLILGSIDAGNWVFVAVILLSSLLNAVYFFGVIERVYAKPPAGYPDDVQPRDPPPSILGPILVLAAGVLILGLINAIIVARVLNLVVASLY
ncbi:monovalent cation/H+ antiporter subunit D family protein [Chloroflexota bacterium]